MNNKEYRNYALGYAINGTLLFTKAPLAKFKLSREFCLKNYRCFKRDLIARIFKTGLRMILEDIVDNNITFQLPGKIGEAELRMKVHKDKEFIELRKLGKFLNIDFLKSNFRGYLVYYFRNRNGYIIEKPIYLTHLLRDRIVENTNNGKVYG